MRAAILVALCLFAQSSVAASRCSVPAWSLGEGGEGLPVRAAPDRSASALGRLPPPRDFDGTSLKVETQILDIRDGWVLIRDGVFRPEGKKPIRAFKGEGWVEEKEIGFQIRDLRVFPTPDIARPTLGELRPPDEDDSKQVTLKSCTGAYVEIVGTDNSGASIQGWITFVCSDQYALCATPIHGHGSP